MKGTITDTAGNKWRWAQRGKDRYGLEFVSGNYQSSQEVTKGVHEFQAPLIETGKNKEELFAPVFVEATVIGNPPFVDWDGNRWYPDSLVVGEDGRVITGMCPGGDWGV